MFRDDPPPRMLLKEVNGTIGPGYIAVEGDGEAGGPRVMHERMWPSLLIYEEYAQMGVGRGYRWPGSLSGCWVLGPRLYAEFDLRTWDRIASFGSDFRR